MKINLKSKTQTNCTAENNMFSIACSPVAFEILSSKLYSNPVLAIVRELLTNAYDSHKAANKTDVPIKVNFPDLLDKSFIVRDYGLGLSKEDIMEMYTTFFSSTKSDSNDFTGCFGLGSKTPFAYTSSFAVNSYWNGIKYYFLAVKKDGYPTIHCIKEEPTKEENGLEIIIPTDNDPDFFMEASKYLQYIPEILITSNREFAPSKICFQKDNIYLYRHDKNSPGFPYYFTNKVLIKQGQNVYEVSNYLELDLGDVATYITQLSKINTLVIEVPIGTLEITPSRESLSLEAENTTKIQNILIDTYETCKELFSNNKELIKYVDTNTYNRIISEKYFPNNEAAILMAPHNDPECLSYIKIMCCNLVKITSNSKSYPGWFSNNTKFLVVSTRGQLNNRTIEKIKNTCINYNLPSVHIIAPLYQYEDQFLKWSRKIKHTCKLINNIEEFDFGVTRITLNQYFKKYPNTKKPYEKPIDKCIKYAKVKINIKAISQIPYPNAYKATVKDLTHCNSPKNTVIVENISDYHNLVSLLNILLYHLSKENEKNFLLQYLQETLCLDIDPTVDTKHTINFLFVAKSNLRLFKEYPTLTHNIFYGILNLLSTTPFNLFFPGYDIAKHNAILPFLKDCKNLFNLSFKGKQQTFVKNTLIYKNLDKLIKHYAVLISEYENKSIDYTTVVLLKNWNLEDKIILTNKELFNKLPKKLQLIYSIVNSESYQQHKKVCKIQYSNKKGEVLGTAFKLDNIQKCQILKILKGENTNVLFQR